jgi:hypothetical protein
MPDCEVVRIASDVAPWEQAGGGPAAGYFSCLAKKSNQKKATPAPLKPPKKWSSKREAHKLALRAQTYALLIRFDDHFFGSVTGGTAKSNI